MSPLNLDRFSQELVEILPLMFREFSKREDNELTRGKISFPQMVALDYVSRCGRVKMTDLARVLSIKTSSATVLVDRLIRGKMLSRKRDAKDRRLVWVGCTEKGKNVVSHIMDQKRQSMKKIFGPLTESERRQYLSVIRKVRDTLLKEHGK